MKVFIAFCLALLTLGGAEEVPRCNVATAPCFTILSRKSTAALAIASLSVETVYRDGVPLIRGSQYQVLGLAKKRTVTITLPANTSGKAERFQVVE